MRAGLLEDPLRGQLREALRAYSDARIALGGSRSRTDELRAARRESEALHVAIWSVVESANRPTTHGATLGSLIMDVNHPQRGMIEVGVAPLKRAAESISAPTG